MIILLFITILIIIVWKIGSDNYMLTETYTLGDNVLVG